MRGARPCFVGRRSILVQSEQEHMRPFTVLGYLSILTCSYSTARSGLIDEKATSLRNSHSRNVSNQDHPSFLGTVTTRMRPAAQHTHSSGFQASYN